MNVLAAIDIGTNSVRMMVVELHPDGSWTTLDSSREMIRLGEGEFHGGRRRISDAAMDRCARVCARFADIAKGFGARELIALATAAAREAANQDELVARVEKASSGEVDVRIISGDEEARLIYLGVNSGIELADSEQALFMDIGGGSTELIIGDKHKYTFLNSLKMGAIRLTGEIMPNRTRTVTPDVWNRLQRTVRSIVEPAARRVRREGFRRMFGSAGTIMSLAEIAARRKGDAGPVTLRNFELHLADVQQISQMLCRLTLEQRRKVPGLAAERADIVVAGAAIVQTVMETVGAQSIFISDRGLREGILIDYLLREGGKMGITAEAERDMLRDASVRERSTKRLARRTQIDEEHARTVIALSAQLFDRTKALGLHDFGSDERELLSYGALLHDCGFFVSHTSHHLHSYYLIRHSELLGFNDLETEVIAQIALFHRKGLPKDKNASFAALPPQEQHVVRVLSCLVRLAEALDRSHLGLVRSVRLTRAAKLGPVRMSADIAPGADPALELWAIVAQQEAFRKTFGADLIMAEPQAGQASEDSALAAGLVTAG
jgi:exopolyphosphatase / guanosine-5'-triphosphate,3'-diphosphate pyrophosphatase